MNQQGQIDQPTVDILQDLIRANLAGRDQLYNAAEKLDNEALRRVCRRLADELGGHVAELQQFLLSHHTQPAGPETGTGNKLGQVLRDTLQQRPLTDEAVLADAEQHEHALKSQYHEAIQTTPDRHTRGILHQHRQATEFGADVLHALAEAKREATPSGRGEPGPDDPSSPPPTGESPAVGPDENPTLASLPVEELRKMAAQRQITGRSRMSKSQLLEALRQMP